MAGALFHRPAADGDFDKSFNVNDIRGNSILSLIVQPDGKFVVAGSFTNFNGMACGNIIRLNDS